MLIKSNIRIMTLEKYQKIRIVSVVITAVIFSQSVLYKNYLIPIAVLTTVSLVLLYLRRSVKEVIADERDHAIGGRAALWTIQIYSWMAVIAMFIFYAFRDINPAYEPIGMMLAFSTCILMFLYAAIFRYYNRISFSDKKLIYITFILAMTLGLFIVSARLLSGEDDWICQNGRWIKHGDPSFSAPSVECK